MNPENQHIDDSLLLLYLQGKTDDEANRMILEWLNRDPVHRHLLDQLEALWLETGKIQPAPIAVDVDAAWDKVWQRASWEGETMLESAEDKKPPRIRYFTYALRLAAILVIALGAYTAWWFLSRPKTVEIMATAVVVKDTLPDGSFVTLNKGTKLTYPSKFAGNVRKVTLQGEAMFSVAHDRSHPFIVETGSAEVKVLGTEFDVSAYSGTATRVSVSKGKVLFFRVDPRTDDTLSVILTAGMSGVLEPDAQTPEIVANPEADSQFWVNHTLNFRETPLSEVLKILMQYYPVKIELSNPAAGKCRLTADFGEEDIGRILQVVAESFGMEVKSEGQHYILYGKGC
jgi:transmembrane sensor